MVRSSAASASTASRCRTGSGAGTVSSARRAAFSARSPASRPAAIAWRSAASSPTPAARSPARYRAMRFARAVSHPVAVDQVVVHAEPEVQQLLRSGDVGEQRAIVAAEAEVRRGDQSRTQVLAAVRCLGLVEEFDRFGADIGAAGAHAMPLRGSHRRRRGPVRLDLGLEPSCGAVGRRDRDTAGCREAVRRGRQEGGGAPTARSSPMMASCSSSVDDDRPARRGRMPGSCARNRRTTSLEASASPYDKSQPSDDVSRAQWVITASCVVQLSILVRRRPLPRA